MFAVEIGYLPGLIVSIAAAAVTAIQLLHIGDRLGGKPVPREVQKSIGVFIRLLIPLQVAMIAMAGIQAIPAVLVFLIFFLPLAEWAGGRFRAS
jgi:hypothetical protein